MTILNKDILKKQKSSLVKKHIDEWDCDVYFKKFSINDATTLEKWNSKKNITGVETLLNLIMLACVDENGNHIFKPEDREELMQIEANVLDKLVKYAEEDTSIKDHDIEEKAKNS